MGLHLYQFEIGWAPRKWGCKTRATLRHLPAVAAEPAELCASFARTRGPTRKRASSTPTPFGSGFDYCLAPELPTCVGPTVRACGGSPKNHGLRALPSYGAGFQKRLQMTRRGANSDVSSRCYKTRQAMPERHEARTQAAGASFPWGPVEVAPRILCFASNRRHCRTSLS